MAHMLTATELKEELKTKERNVSDLLRFLITRSDNMPNYNLLLGSGCSVTSGIKSGGQLIEQWRKEIYEGCNNKQLSYNPEDAIEYLSKQCGSWYNKNNEYSSLFEKKYDLARQRRMFVEQQVDGKTPSIGYAYLINLIRNSYFGTVFTTNFDDLINEAFYQFSDIRPIMCAHDSSITSITVTSKRPKIIKLHGDYLFDDIKSTLRETESLEENIRNKFIEFAKDFGLVVVGYSGNDRSIMDVLSFLLKHEDYYKNGIYWCLRSTDIVSEDLRKLLWKDKVYFVLIDGFDELFAELHHNIFNDKLPIDTNFVSSKSQDVIQKFLNNEYLKSSKSQAINRDLKNLGTQNERNNIYELLKQIQLDKNIGTDKIDNKEAVLLIQITTLIKDSNYNDALDLIENASHETSNKHFKIELLKKSVRAYLKLDKIKEARKASDQLIELEPRNPAHLLVRFDFEQDYAEKLSWIEKAIKLDEYDAEFYSEKAEFLIENYDFTRCDKGHSYSEIMTLLNNSIEKHPSIDNASWFIKFRFLKRTKPDEKSELQRIIQELSKQNPHLISLLEAKRSIILEKSDLSTFLDEVLLSKEKVLTENKVDYDILYLDILDDLNEKEKISDYLKKLDALDLYKDSHVFIRNKAILLLKKFDRLHDSIELLKDSLKSKESKVTVNILIDHLIYSENVVQAKEYFESYKKLFSRSEKIKIEKDLLEAEKNYALAFEKLKELQEHNHNKDKFISTLSYLLLKQKKFVEAKDMLNEFLKERSFNRNLESELINYEIASMKTGHKPDKQRLNDLKQFTKSNLVKAAIYAIEENYDKTFELLNEVLDADATEKYIFKDWCVFEPINTDPRYLAFFC